jgi:PAS domain S-box-containing protein
MGMAMRDRLSAPASLLATNDLLRQLVQGAPVAIVAVDQVGQILYANSKLAEMFGYEIAELVEQPLEMLLPERYRDDHRVYRAYYGENPHVRPMGSGLDLAGRHKDGSEFPIEVGLSFVRNEDSLVVLAALTDITRRKQTEELLEARVQERTRELERRREVADSLREILTLLNSNQSLQEILDTIVVQASRLLGADASAILQLSEGDNQFRIQASTGLGSDELAFVTASSPGQSAAHATEAGAAATVTMRQGWETESRASGIYCAQLAVPLKVKEESFGSLVLYYLHPRRFAAEEIELAVMYGDQAALAIENARLRLQVERTAVTAERNRIARDLHDSVTQTLFSASLIAEVLPRLVERNPGESVRRLEELRQLTRGALAEMRTLLLELRPATLTEVGMEELLRQLSEATRGRARVPVTLEIDGVDALPPDALPPDVKTAFYYVAQEALNNVVKHAHAQQIDIFFGAQADGATLIVRDDGQGFDSSLVTPEHLGLQIMRERTESIDAVLEIQSRPGAGTQVRIQWANGEYSHA